MTAIASGKTNSGIIIAADGRVRIDEESRNANPELIIHETEDARKIFEIIRPNAQLAYAMAGSLINNDFSFDLRYKGQDVAQRLLSESFSCSAEYLPRFMDGLAETVTTDAYFPTVNGRDNDGWIIANVIIAGYFQDESVLAYATIHHDGNSAYCRNIIPSDRPILYGSGQVIRNMYDINFLANPCFIPRADSNFQAYQVRLSINPSLDDMDKFCAGYIEACKTGYAQSNYPSCAIIGGHIHIAEITPIGFRWRVRPKEKCDSGLIESPEG